MTTEAEAFEAVLSARRAEAAAHDVHRQKTQAERRADRTLELALASSAGNAYAEAAYRQLFAARQAKAAAFDAWSAVHGKRLEAEERLDAILARGGTA